MMAREAVEQIRNTVFKPGWRISGYELDSSFIMVQFVIETVDTSYPDADGTCRRPIRLGPDTVINVRRLDEAGLAHELLRFAAQLDEHENREFLKIRQPDGSWHAPLHPHTDAGNEAWALARFRAPARNY
jgi:hypothetical protein